MPKHPLNKPQRSPALAASSATSDSRWSERNIRYDLDGNLLHLERYQDNANTPQAMLDFSYIGPKRVGYAYDSNGNITYDPLRCFEIRYNLLNLASEVIGHDPEESADSTSASAGNGVSAAIPLCETVYYADGTRSGVQRPDEGLWFSRYVSSLICDGDSEFLYPKGVVTDFGYIDLQSGKMQYFLRDHLGSVRVIAEDRHTVISRTDYLPFGVRMSGDGLTGGNATARSSFFGFSGKENEMWGGLDSADGDITPHWLKGERYQHFGARAYDPVSCIFMQVDPMAEKYYGMTPYGYCAGSPVMMVDKSGKEYSTHTDKNGKVLAVYKDGDLGVYRHDNAMCIADFSQNYSSEDTSAGGELVGYSLQEESFSSFAGANNLRIKFNSAELTDRVTEIVRSNPSIIQYALKARAHGDWDLKTKVYDGSLLFGKYASPKDAGNFAAGMISQSKGDNISFIIDFGYGAYNKCKNKMIPTAILCLKVLLSKYPLLAMWYIAKYGEDAVSKKAQSLGKEYYKTHVYGKDK